MAIKEVKQKEDVKIVSKNTEQVKSQYVDGKGFVWKYLRIGFYVMIIYYISDVIFGILNKSLSVALYKTLPGVILSFVFMALVIFTFVMSIIHLTRYKKKALSITSLVISSLLLFVFVVSVIAYSVKYSVA